MRGWTTLALTLLLATAAIAAGSPEAPPAYIIADIEVTDPQGYKAYVAAVTPIVADFGGTYLVRAGRTVAFEGPLPAGRTVVIAFPSMAAAQAFQASPRYLEIAKLRQRASTGRIFIVEGVAE
jgi:uncharacterized protein (DUF1330 family)